MARQEFSQRIWSIIREIPKGKVSTYKEVARAMHTKAYRAVGNALRSNPDPINTPCFKIVKSEGSLGGYASGEKEKIRRLKEEGIEVEDWKIVDFEKRLFRFRTKN